MFCLLQQKYLHQNVYTFATPCDGVAECRYDQEWNGTHWIRGESADEWWICTNKTKPAIWFLTGVFVIMLTFIALKVQSKYGTLDEPTEEFENEHPTRNTDELISVYKNGHGNPEFMKQLNFHLTKIMFQERDENHTFMILSKILDLEFEIHGYSIAETYCCFRNHIHSKTFNEWMSIVFPGFITTKIIDPLRNRISPANRKKLRENRIIQYLLYILLKSKSIFFIFSDNLKDIILVGIILVVVGGSSALTNYPTIFTSTVRY